MEEESTPVQEEETSAPSASETESAPEVETSEADTLDQPTEEATAEETKPNRAQERIKRLAAERDYWKDLAPAPSQPEESGEEGEVTVKEVARQTAEEVHRTIRQEDARKNMLQDAMKAEEAYPQLADDEDLAADVLAVARGRQISITAAAERVIGRQVQQVKQARGKAEQNLKAQASTPQSRKVNTGEPAPLNLNQLSEEDKAANWSQIISNLSSGE
ncbi:MAG: hypothetical protein H0U60_20030 [Blastocatellia bacterium]|nr:hypothetical protein [Blastocatellia bacterium]